MMATVRGIEDLVPEGSSWREQGAVHQILQSLGAHVWRYRCPQNTLAGQGIATAMPR